MAIHIELINRVLGAEVTDADLAGELRCAKKVKSWTLSIGIMFCFLGLGFEGGSP